MPQKTKIKTTGIFARVVGYYRPVSAWNAGKKQEWADRQLTALADSNKQDKQ